MDNKNEIWLRISSWTLNSSFIIHLINYFSFDGFLFISLQFGNFKSAKELGKLRNSIGFC